MSGRKVHFSEPLHQIEFLDKQWEIDSRLARDGSEWVRIGLDRQRFQDRIERTAEILNRILDTNFRQKIYRERFENFVITNEQLQQEITNKLAKAKITASENETTCTQSSIDASQRQITDQRQEKIANTTSNSNQNNNRRKRSRFRKGNNKNNNRHKHRGGHRKKN